VSIRVDCRTGVTTGPEPITLGVPFAAGALVDPEMLRLRDEHGAGVPLQARVLERWRDGSARWVLVDFQAGPAASSSYALTWAGTPQAAQTRMLQIAERAGEVSVDTGAARFVIRTGGRLPVDQVSVDGREILDVIRSGLTATDEHGRPAEAIIDRVTVEESGQLRAVVGVFGRLTWGRRVLLHLIVRLHFFAGVGVVRAVVTVRNPRRASHPGGYWELGDHGSVYLRDLSLTVALHDEQPAKICCSAELGLPFQSSPGPLSLYQDSSGGENWASRVNVNRQGEVTATFRGYRLRDGGVERTGMRSTPYASIATGSGSAGLALRQFWQNCPKALEAADNAIVLRLWPRQYADLHELQGGEQKTHDIFLDIGGASARPPDWLRTPSTVTVDPSWYAAAGAVPYLSAASDCTDPQYLRLIQSAIDGPDSFARKREVADEYGWRHFGDLYADHEGTQHGGPGPIVSHYNNQYDAVGAFAVQFMRSGDSRWRELMDDLARHVADIDTYHTDRDKAAYNNALFWHTSHYVDAGKCTHRSYPREPKVGGGGPGNEHNYSTGLMLHYLMSGDPLSRETVVGYARWVVAMDDGGATPFRWLARGHTGLASQTASATYHGPGRGAGYSICALLDGHRLTGDEVFLAKAEELIRRAIHPSDNLETGELLAREQRWSYTVFLQALGRYLDYKAERGSLDAMYAYARTCLLRYAEWMARHEYPYLDRPEQLEFPTETWAAQDVRKSEVFDLAARHARGTQRDVFLDRAAFFWRYTIDQLTAMPTRTMTRPMVLLLGHGLLRDHMRRCPDDRAPLAEVPVADEDVHGALAFEPQKVRAMRRFTWLASAAASASVAVALWWLLRLL